MNTPTRTSVRDRTWRSARRETPYATSFYWQPASARKGRTSRLDDPSEFCAPRSAKPIWRSFFPKVGGPNWSSYMAIDPIESQKEKELMVAETVTVRRSPLSHLWFFFERSRELILRPRPARSNLTFIKKYDIIFKKDLWGGRTDGREEVNLFPWRPDISPSQARGKSYRIILDRKAGEKILGPI